MGKPNSTKLYSIGKKDPQWGSELEERGYILAGLPRITQRRRDMIGALHAWPVLVSGRYFRALREKEKFSTPSLRSAAEIGGVVVYFSNN